MGAGNWNRWGKRRRNDRLSIQVGDVEPTGQKTVSAGGELWYGFSPARLRRVKTSWVDTPMSNPCLAVFFCGIIPLRDQRRPYEAFS